jgi:hypothetical protein
MREFTYKGMAVHESCHISPLPRMQVSPEFARIQSPELVASTNAWMLEFFGTYSPIYILQDKDILVSPDNYDRFFREAFAGWAWGAPFVAAGWAAK